MRTELRPITEAILPTRRNYKGISRTDSAIEPELENFSGPRGGRMCYSTRPGENFSSPLGGRIDYHFHCESHTIIDTEDWRSCHDLICIGGSGLRIVLALDLLRASSEEPCWFSITWITTVCDVLVCIPIFTDFHAFIKIHSLIIFMHEILPLSFNVCLHS